MMKLKGKRHKLPRANLDCPVVHFAKRQQTDHQMDWYHLFVAQDDVGADMEPL